MLGLAQPSAGVRGGVGQLGAPPIILLPMTNNKILSANFRHCQAELRFNKTFMYKPLAWTH